MTRRIPWLALAAWLITTACGLQAIPTTDSPSAQVTDDPIAGTAHAGEVHPGDVSSFPFAGLTPLGIPVEVIDDTDAGFVVHSPCGHDAIVSAVRPFGRVKVVLDPGHGGPVDTGSVGSNGLRESHLNLTVAKAVQEELDERGIRSAITRAGDYAMTLAARTRIADASGAKVFVSIHHNAPAAAKSDAPGTEVFVQSNSSESSRLGGLLYEEVVAKLRAFDVAWTRAHDAGVLRVHRGDGTDAYGVLRRPATPTALLELGYLDNPAEATFFATDEYVKAAATAVATAIDGYLRSDRAGRGFVAEPRTLIPVRSRATEACIDPDLES